MALEKPTATPTSTIVVHSPQKVTDYFNQAFGRDPTSSELQTWQARIDKDGAQLLGAMQYGFDRDLTVALQPKTASPETVDAVFAEAGETLGVVTTGAYNNVALDWDWTINDPALLASATQEATSYTGAEIWDYVLNYWPYEPMSNKGFLFYLENSNRENPDYVVSYDSLSPEAVDEIHPGGVYSVRIRRIGCIGGAQVILDANGSVIPGAGSYDKISPRSTGSFSDVPFFLGHWLLDYGPWWISNEVNGLN